MNLQVMEDPYQLLCGSIERLPLIYSRATIRMVEAMRCSRRGNLLELDFLSPAMVFVGDMEKAHIERKYH